MILDYKEIINRVRKKNLIPRTLVMIFGAFLLALNYNVFFLPNNLVVGGTSGLAIVFNNLCGFTPSNFILITGIILLIFSFIFLGREQTERTIVGSLLYPIFVKITTPLAILIIPHVNFDSMFLTTIVAGLLFGFANGIIFKAGFTTGGSDIINQILSDVVKIPRGKATFATNFVIICTGGFVFGIKGMLYAIIILIISSNLIDRILIGISDSKMFFIYTKKTAEIENFIINELHTGVTIFNTEGGFSKHKQEMLMCVVHTKDYFLFKESILSIDPDAFFVINDCYEVSGGKKRSNLPFI